MGEAIHALESTLTATPKPAARPYGPRLWLPRRALRWSVRSAALFFAAAGLLMAAARADRGMCLRILGVEDTNTRSLMGYRSLIADVDAGRIALENRFPPRREFAYLPILGRALYTTDDGRYPPMYALILQGASGIFSEDFILQTRMIDAFDSEDPSISYNRYLIDRSNRSIVYLWRSAEGIADGGMSADRLSVSDTATGQTRTADLGNASPYTYMNSLSDDGAFAVIRRADALQTLSFWSLASLTPLTSAPNFLTGAWVPGQPIFVGVALEPEGRSIMAWSPVNGTIAKRVVPLGEAAGRAGAEWQTLVAPDGSAFALQHIEPVCSGSSCPDPHFEFDLYNAGGDLIAAGLRGDALRQGTNTPTASPQAITASYRQSALWGADSQTFYFVSTPDATGTPPITGTLYGYVPRLHAERIIVPGIRTGLTDTIFFPMRVSRYYSAAVMQDRAAQQRLIVPIAQPGGRIAVDLMNIDGSNRMRALDGVDSVDLLRNPFYYYFQGLGWAADGKTVVLPWATPARAGSTPTGITWAALDGSGLHTLDGLSDIDLVNLAIDQTTRRASRYIGFIEPVDRARILYRFELVNLDTARRYPVTLPPGTHPRDWATWFAPGGRYASVAFSTSGSTSQGGAVAVIDLETGDTQIVPGGYISAWALDGSRVAIGSGDALGRQVIDIRTMETGVQRRLIPETLNETRTLSWNPCR